MFIFCLLQKRSHNINIILDLPPHHHYYVLLLCIYTCCRVWKLGSRGRVLWSMTQPVKLSFNEAKKKTKQTKKRSWIFVLSASQSWREEVTSLRKQLQLGKSNEQPIVEEGQSLAMNTLIHSNWKMGALTH